MMNDFQRLCRKLDKDKKSGALMLQSDNVYICVKAMTKQYTNNDINKLSKIEIDAEASNWWKLLSLLISVFSMFVATATLLLTMVNEIIGKDIWFLEFFELLIVISLVILVIVVWVTLARNYRISAWRGYIQVAVVELKKEMKEEKSKKNKKDKKGKKR